jgi:hypothetical protein
VSRRIATLALGAALLAGCASKPAAEVRKEDMQTVRSTYADITPGQPKDAVLAAFKAGNKVKLGSSMVGDATVEEWKVEAYHDENKRKDLFVTFLYFCNDRFVDGSDTRIDFRNNPQLVEQWTKSLPQ